MVGVEYLLYFQDCNNYSHLVNQFAFNYLVLLWILLIFNW